MTDREFQATLAFYIQSGGKMAGHEDGPATNARLRIAWDRALRFCRALDLLEAGAEIEADRRGYL